MSDLIEVRPDERFDVERLAGWLADAGEGPGGTPVVSQFGGGKANLTYLLTFPGGEELVLRRPPLGPVAPGSHDMGREYRVLSRLWEVFDKAPRAVAFCDDETVIGSDFFLMERRDGVVVRSQVPERFGGGADPAANRKLSEVVIDTLAELHTVDPASCGLDDIGHPEGFLARQVQGWSGRWDRAKHEENPLADELAAWLAEELPPGSSPTLLHNDWRLDNMAVSPDDPGVCVAVYDWDMATRGDPLADLGTLMGSWFDPGEAPGSLSMMPTQIEGWMDRGAAVARYTERSGASPDHLDWYLVFGAWKLAVILQQIYIRWLRGQTQDERFADLDDGARHLLRLAAARRP
ncbi:MAG TPA: phosphotransferase family protein [Acidimicrobiia bacterium]|nr:phosphotransferase family protein [Acidimicrobiia bacterium]